MRKIVCLFLFCVSFCLTGQEENPKFKDTVSVLSKSGGELDADNNYKVSIEGIKSVSKTFGASGSNSGLTYESQKKLAEKYQKTGKDQKAIIYLNSLIAEEEKKENPNNKYLADLYDLLASSQKKLKQSVKMEESLKNSFHLSQNSNYKTAKRNALFDLGMNSFFAKDYKKADEYFGKSADYGFKVYSNDHEVKSYMHFLLYFIRTKIQIGGYKEAEKLLDEAEGIANEHNKTDYLTSFSLLFVDLYKRQNVPEKVIYWYEKSVVYNRRHQDKINGINKEKLKLKYDLELKENELIIANKEKRIEENKAKFSKVMFYLITILLVILVVIVYLMYVNKKKVKRLNHTLNKNNRKLVKAKNDLESLSNIKSNFFSIISHELRTPLYTITGIAELLIRGMEKQNKENLFKSLKYASEHLICLVNNMLHTNSIEKDKELKVDIQSFKLRELITNLVTTFKYYSHKSDTKLHLMYDDRIDDVLVGDFTKLSQVINNLISNAVKFTHNGNVWLRIELQNDYSKNQQILFTVQDDGIGLDIDKQKTILKNDFIFEPLQFDRKYEGSGLGLYISEKLLNCMGSNIEVESKVNLGSTFSFSLLLDKAKQWANGNGLMSPAYDNSIELRDFTGRKIVVVDDNAVNLKITKRILERRNFETSTFDSPDKAIAFLKEHKCDIVLMDLQMPKIDGYQASKLIREFDGDTPIIALTATSCNNNRERALSLGMNDLISKPFVVEELFRIIAKHLVKAKHNAYL